MKAKFSNRNTNETVTGQFYVTYRARNKYSGKVYETVHLNPITSGINPNESVNTADEVNERYQKRYNGRCPFNADTDFEVVRIQQRS
jgi:hypothetical protein